MRRIFLSVISMMMLSVCAIAQPGGGGGGGGGMGGGGGQGGQGQGGQQGQGSGMENTDFVGATGLFELEYETVVKKCKVKEEEEKQKVLAILSEYQASNKATEEKFKEEFYLIKTIQAKIDAGAATTSLRNDMKSLMEGTRKIKSETIPTHKKLSDAMIVNLNTKSAQKWLKYYTKLCEKMTFSTIQRQIGQRQMGQGGGQQGGQGGQGGGGQRGGF